jgi:hypothetical protein
MARFDRQPRVEVAERRLIAAADTPDAYGLHLFIKRRRAGRNKGPSGPLTPTLGTSPSARQTDTT